MSFSLIELGQYEGRSWKKNDLRRRKKTNISAWSLRKILENGLRVSGSSSFIASLFLWLTVGGADDYSSFADRERRPLWIRFVLVLRLLCCCCFFFAALSILGCLLSPACRQKIWGWNQQLHCCHTATVSSSGCWVALLKVGTIHLSKTANVLLQTSYYVNQWCKAVVTSQV